MLKPKNNRLFPLISKLATLFLPKRKTANQFNGTGICTLLCHRDVDKGIYMLFSLFRAIDEILPVFIVEDGSLTEIDKNRLNKYFTVTIAGQDWCDKQMHKRLSKYKNILSFRFSHEVAVPKKKLDALLLNTFKKYIFVEPDILFFRPAKEIKKWLHSSQDYALYSHHIWNQNYGIDDSPEMVIRRIYYKLLKCNNPYYFSCGLFGFNSSSAIPLKALDKACKLVLDAQHQRSWVAEEHVLANLFCQINAKSLRPTRYKNYWLPKQYFDEKNKSGIICIHYGGDSKYIFSQDAIRLLLRTRFFSV